MSDLVTRSARLIPYVKRPRNAAGFATAYRYEPLPGDPGSILGSLYVVIEVLVSGRSGEDLADLIIETAGEHYYNRPKAENDHLSRFEEAIKAVNHALIDHVNKGNASWIGKLSAIIAVQTGSELHLSQTGSADAYLYRGRSGIKITNQANDKPATPSKTFGFIASGELNGGDRILITTPAMTHQISTTKIQELITAGSPNMAIAEITELLKNVASERMASIIIEVMAPEHAAMQVRPEGPDEIKLDYASQTDPIETAIQNAGPLASATMESGRQLKKVAKLGLLSGFSKIKQNRPQTPAATNSKKILIIAAIFVVILSSIAGVLLYNQSKSAAESRAVDQYTNYYRQYLTLSVKTTDDSSGTRQKLTKLQQELTNFSRSADSKDLGAYLARAKLAAGEPKSVASLQSAISLSLDQIDKLSRVSGEMVASISAKTPVGNQKMEIYNGRAYVIDGNEKSLSIVNLSDFSVTKSAASIPGSAGKIVATTLAYNNSGLYLLTDTPSVWLYRLGTDSLSEVKNSGSLWPKSSAISSYLTNLYLIGGDTLYKATSSDGTGFNAPASYIDGTDSACLKGATSIAINGSVYVASAQAVCEYLFGVEKSSATLPNGLEGSVRSAKLSGDQLLTVAPSTQRIGVWSVTASLSFIRQYQLKDLSGLDDAAIDPKTGYLYALAQGKLYKVAKP